MRRILDSGKAITRVLDSEMLHMVGREEGDTRAYRKTGRS